MDLASFGRKGLVTALEQDLGDLQTKRRGIRGTRSGLTPLQMQRLLEKLREARRNSGKRCQFIWLDHGLGVWMFRMPTFGSFSETLIAKLSIC